METIIKNGYEKFYKEAKILKNASMYKIFRKGNSVLLLLENKKIHKEKELLFGFTYFESREDIKDILKMVRKFLKENDIEEIIGPINYCSWFSYRWTSKKEGYEKKLGLEPINEEFYVEEFEKFGFKEDNVYTSSIVYLDDSLQKRSKRIYEKVIKDKKYTFKICENLDEGTIKEMFKIGEEAFSSNPYYMSIPFSIFLENTVSSLKSMNYKFSLCYKEDKLIGFSIGYESPYDKETFIIKTTAFKKDNENKLLPIAFRYFGNKYCIGLGFKRGVYHFQLRENTASLKMRGYEAKIIREYKTFRYKV